MDVGTALALGFLWLLLSLFGKKRGGGSKPRQPGAEPQRRPSGAPTATGADATQREGGRLQDLLQALAKTLDQGTGPRGRPAAGRLPPAEEVEETESLEGAPEAQSLEGEVRRPERAVVDRDDEAETIAAGRIATAEKRSRPHTRADHAAFDERIRREAADATAVRASNIAQLRKAVVWREILGPPVSLRAHDEL